jgi:parallel beta-helix repeat protein
MRCSILSSALAIILATASIGLTATIHVPADQPTIQGGIDVAVEGDTVLVADGTFTGDGNRDIDFLGKAIVVMSENGPDATIIDCEGDSLDPHRGFYFHSQEDSSSVIHGFTITNGYASYEYYPESMGGGIYCYYSSPTITGNTITRNKADTDGGGIYSWVATPIIADNIIAGNIAERFDGGGIFCAGGIATITNNIITGNSAWQGGGIYCLVSSAVITNNMILENTAFDDGGGIDCSLWTAPSITGNLIADNRAYDDGGGIYCEHSVPTILDNTMSGNVADSSGGGLYNYWSATLLVNSILWANSSGADTEISMYGPEPLTVVYSDIEGGWPGAGNIDADPLFVDPGNGDYDLQADSPCIDTGYPHMPCRPWGGWRIDMGASEYDQDFYWDGQNLIKKPFPVDLPLKR